MSEYGDEKQQGRRRGNFPNKSPTYNPNKIALISKSNKATQVKKS